jgi:hypothetical protein
MQQHHIQRFARHRGRASIATPAIACLLNTSVALAAVHYTGVASAGNGTLLYRESHWLYQDNNVDTRLVLYTCPDGRAFARKHVWNRPNAQAPNFEFEDARDGFSEGAYTQGDIRRVFLRARADAAERSAAFVTSQDTVIDAGFDAFVRAHWDVLTESSALPISFLLPSRLAALNFSVRRVADERVDGHNARRFRLTLARWYGGLLPHIDVVYDSATRTLLHYEGVGNIRSADARNLDVRIDFPAAERMDNVSDADAAAAGSVALNGTCALQ